MTVTSDSEPTAFGKPMLKHWRFDPSYTNLNHGSFGAFPTIVREKQHAIHDLVDNRPDPYIRVAQAKLFDQAREEVAAIIHAPKDECVFVKNATSGVFTVLFNLNFQKDEAIIYFETVYGAVEYGFVSLQEHSPLQARKVPFEFPTTADELERRFRDVLSKARADGLKVRAAVFDAVVSNPGVRFPFERFVKICREESILSVIDGAHGIGMIPLNMEELQPDFLVSNCHKWLYTPRGAAVLYVPKRNQHFIRTTLPTSWGFIPGPKTPADLSSAIRSISIQDESAKFQQLFEQTATDDDSSYVCVPTALKFRKEVCGGEEAIMSYCQTLANEAADLIAAALGTDVLQEPDLKPGEKSNMRQCCMTTIRLPIGVAGADLVGAWGTLSSEEMDLAAVHIQQLLVAKYETFLPIFRHGPWLWTRVSGQVYLEKSDFEWVAGVLRELCEKVAQKDFSKDFAEKKPQNAAK
ncbi:hypothetical protein N7540_012386 [Penicillium herquei]|nr:hypothetical protein N7540_012386 [Penicillium herquei]